MSTYQWQTFLARWSAELLEDAAYRQTLPEDVVASGWLGYPGATEQQLTAAEARLETRLPPSYRAFLRASNGWRRTSPFIDRVWSTDEIAWFQMANQEWIDAWTEESEGLPAVSDQEYYIYGPSQDSCVFRTEYLQTALQISAVGNFESCVYLLNPQVVTPDGEWEAWFMANWTPGLNRYRSFWELMREEHETFLRLRQPKRGR